MSAASWVLLASILVMLGLDAVLVYWIVRLRSLRRALTEAADEMDSLMHQFGGAVTALTDREPK